MDSAATVSTIVLVRPWTDNDAGTGCCGGRVQDAVCLGDDRPNPGETRHDHREGRADDPVAAAYRRLRDGLPDIDVQVVSSTNTGYLVPWAYRSWRRAGAGAWSALRRALGTTRAGVVIVDGKVVADCEADSLEDVVTRVRERLVSAGPVLRGDVG